MDIFLNDTVSASEIQRNYRKVFNRAKKTKRPLIILRGSNPDIALVDLVSLEEMQKKVEAWEVADTLEAIRVAEKERKEGKLKALKLGDLAKLAAE